MTYRSQKWVERFPKQAAKLGPGEWDERGGYRFRVADTPTTTPVAKLPCTGCGKPDPAIPYGSPAHIEQELLGG